MSDNSVRPVRSAGVVVAVAAALVIAPLVTATGADAAPRTAHTSSTGTSAFTAEIASVNHGLRRVTLRGTAPVGTSVELAGDVDGIVWTEAGRDGTWTGQVRMRRGDDLRVRVTSAVSGTVVELPVQVRGEALSPVAEGIVDGVEQTVTVRLTAGEPRARFELYDGDRHVDTVRADGDGAFTYVFTGLTFGPHHLEAWQYYDGEHNGGWDEVFQIVGAPVIESSAVSRDDGVVRIAGRAPRGSTVTVSDASGPVIGADGQPVRVQVGAGRPERVDPPAARTVGAPASASSWSVALPIPADTRFATFRATATLDGVELGSADTAVTIPNEITGTVEELPDGSIRVSGTGEPGGVVALETERGDAIDGVDGEPVTTTIGRSWQLVVRRDLLHEETVVVRQRVQGVSQGSLHLVVPKPPTTPVFPGDDVGTGTGTGNGLGTGGHSGGGGAGQAGSVGAPQGIHDTKPRSIDPLRARPTRLAWTGVDVTPAVIAGGGLLVAGIAALVGIAVVQRRAQPTRRGRRRA